MKDCTGRVAVSTGGASGIGLAIAEALRAEGAKIVLADVEAEALEAAVAGLGGPSDEVFGVVTDVSKEESVAALADRVFEVFGACHLLFNNAGVGAPSASIWETTINDWKWVHGVNVMGVVHGVLAFVPRMIESGEEGHVINTSSGDGGISPLPDQSVYASSKAAVSILTECLADQLAASDTTAVLLPGTIFFLGKDHYAPARSMIARGCALALATDFNPGSSHPQSMAAIITLACLKLHMTPAECIQAVTINAAASLHLDDQIGTLHPGKRADLVALDLPSHQCLGYAFGGNPVGLTVVGGEPALVNTADRDPDLFQVVPGITAAD